MPAAWRSVHGSAARQMRRRSRRGAYAQHIFMPRAKRRAMMILHAQPAVFLHAIRCLFAMPYQHYYFSFSDIRPMIIIFEVNGHATRSACAPRNIRLSIFVFDIIYATPKHGLFDARRAQIIESFRIRRLRCCPSPPCVVQKESACVRGGRCLPDVFFTYMFHYRFRDDVS